MNAKNIFISVDFIGAVAVAAAICLLGPATIPNAVAKDLYASGISVLSIVFSVFFAALTTIASSSDDDFVRFLDEGGEYREIIWAFRITLFVLFVALLASLVAYGVTAIWDNETPKEAQPSYFIAAFAFLFTWGMLATFNSAGDAIRYAVARVRFLRRMRPPDDSR